MYGSFGRLMVVYAPTKVRNFKQITTASKEYYKEDRLFMHLQR